MALLTSPSPASHGTDKNAAAGCNAGAALSAADEHTGRAGVLEPPFPRRVKLTAAGWVIDNVAFCRDRDALEAVDRQSVCQMRGWGRDWDVVFPKPRRAYHDQGSAAHHTRGEEDGVKTGRYEMIHRRRDTKQVISK